MAWNGRNRGLRPIRQILAMVDASHLERYRQYSLYGVIALVPANPADILANLRFRPTAVGVAVLQILACFVNTLMPIHWRTSTTDVSRVHFKDETMPNTKTNTKVPDQKTASTEAAARSVDGLAGQSTKTSGDNKSHTKANSNKGAGGGKKQERHH